MKKEEIIKGIAEDYEVEPEDVEIKSIKKKGKDTIIKGEVYQTQMHHYYTDEIIIPFKVYR